MVKPCLKTHLELALGLQQLSIPRLAAVPQTADAEIPWSIPHSPLLSLEAVLPGAGQCQCLPASRQGLLVPHEADTLSHKPVGEGSLVWDQDLCWTLEFLSFSGFAQSKPWSVLTWVRRLGWKW